MHPQSKLEIKDRRIEIEAEINELLDNTGSDFTLDDVREVIYNEEDSDDMQKAIAMFDDGKSENLSNIIEAVTDAWNYFPHKLLDGKSPAEIMLEEQKRTK